MIHPYRNNIDLITNTFNLKMTLPLDSSNTIIKNIARELLKICIMFHNL